MPGLNLQGGFGAGGAVDQLRVLVAEAQRKQMEENRVAAEQARLAENARQFNETQPIELGKLGVAREHAAADTRRANVAEGGLALDRDQFDFMKPLRTAESGAEVALKSATTADIQRRPEAEAAEFRRRLDLQNLMQMNELARQHQASTFNISEIQERARQERETNRVAPARGYAPVQVWTDNGLQILDKRTGTTTPVTQAGSGEQVKPQATAGMRERELARDNASKGVVAIKDLSDQLITERGIAQRAKATGMSVESALGANPKYTTYQDARMALAGNLAVLQQGSRPSDADIKAIWLPIVPDVFRDTDESAAMKWGLINTMSGFKPSDTAAQAGAGPAKPKMKPVRQPDGSYRWVSGG